jgi:hypothetical protein
MTKRWALFAQALKPELNTNDLAELKLGPPKCASAEIRTATEREA